MRLAYVLGSVLMLAVSVPVAHAASGDDPFAHVCGGQVPGTGTGSTVPATLAGLQPGRGGTLLGVCVGTIGTSAPARSQPEHPGYSPEAVAELQRWLSHHLAFLHARSDAERTAAAAAAAQAKKKYQALRGAGALVFTTQEAAAAAYIESERQHAAAREGTPEKQLANLRMETAIADLRTMARDGRSRITLGDVFYNMLRWKERQFYNHGIMAYATVVEIHEGQVSAMRARGLTIFPSWAQANSALSRAEQDYYVATSPLGRLLAKIKVDAYRKDRDMLAGSLAARD